MIKTNSIYTLNKKDPNASFIQPLTANSSV